MLDAHIFWLTDLLFVCELLSNLIDKSLAVGVVSKAKKCSAVGTLILLGIPGAETVVANEFGAVRTHSWSLGFSVANNAVQERKIVVSVQIHSQFNIFYRI